jgi:hypothetical protein
VIDTKDPWMRYLAQFPEKLPGPCVVCGKIEYPLSFGGPNICPRCDCGLPPIAEPDKPA